MKKIKLYFPIILISISTAQIEVKGFVFHDKNKNGTMDKNEPGIDTPTKKPDLTPKAPRIIIKTRIIAAITLFCRLFSIVLIVVDWS